MATCPTASDATVSYFQLDEDDVVLTVGSIEGALNVTNCKSMHMKAEDFRTADLEDLEAATVVQLVQPLEDHSMARLERVMMQRRKKGDRVRVVTNHEIHDWGNAIDTREKQFVYENDCRFQMRMQR
jgi:hypothetical protein